MTEIERNSILQSIPIIMLSRHDPMAEFDRLCTPFFQTRPQCSLLDATAVPEPERRLLAHTNHMTVTVEEHYKQPVSVKVLQTLHSQDDYGRKILLETVRSRKVVQFGAVRIDLSVLPPIVQSEIVAGQTPLGRVLIQNDVLTRVEPSAYLRLFADAEFAAWFGVPIGTSLYGRIGSILADGRPAIAMLEVLAPVHLDLDS